MKKISTVLSIFALFAAFTVSGAAKDGGIVDVDTRLNVRSQPSLSSSVKDKLWDGQVITLHEKSGDFWYVEYAPGTFGYVSSQYINTLNLKSATVNITSGTLNVRDGASLSSKVKDSLSKGESVLILGTYGDFYKILYSGNLVGYASKKYLSDGTSAAQRRAITLDLPTYKQYNYPSLRLPGSGESVSTHGCAVTSLAMTESYRTGKTVTPKNVIEGQSFTSSGALYWPSPYRSDGVSLEYIYNQLSLGKPVIIHVKKSNGAAHFAVICGFSGGALTASNFKISDPGSVSRKTLADLYAAYPISVKTLSY